MTLADWLHVHRLRAFSAKRHAGSWHLFATRDDGASFSVRGATVLEAASELGDQIRAHPIASVMA